MCVCVRVCWGGGGSTIYIVSSVCVGCVSLNMCRGGGWGFVFIYRRNVHNMQSVVKPQISLPGAYTDFPH